MRNALPTAVLSAGVALFLAACESSSLVDATDSAGLVPASHGAVVVVWPGDMDGWTASPSVTFENGPAGPPLGAGSAELRPDAFPISQLRNHLYNLVRLETVTEIEYWTYVETGPPNRAAVIMLNVDYDGDGDPIPDDLLIFDPRYQGAAFCPTFPQPVPAANLWQEWDALNGCWYTSEGTAGTAPGTVVPLATILAEEPDAQIVNLNPTAGGMRVAAGSGSTGEPDWAGFVGNVDGVSFAYLDKAATYDFELEDRPVSKADCRDGGWEQHGFKNQGQCNRFVETGKDSR